MDTQKIKEAIEFFKNFGSNDVRENTQVALHLATLLLLAKHYIKRSEMMPKKIGIFNNPEMLKIKREGKNSMQKREGTKCIKVFNKKNEVMGITTFGNKLVIATRRGVLYVS